MKGIEKVRRRATHTYMHIPSLIHRPQENLGMRLIHTKVVYPSVILTICTLNPLFQECLINLGSLNTQIGTVA